MTTLDDQDKRTYLEELCELIRIPSRSTPEGGEEGPLQRRVAAKMKELGARVRTFDPTDIPGFLTHPLCSQPERQYADRPTVLAEIGPPDAPALLVLAHSDTVPLAKPEEWSFDPFGGEIRDGNILGLGVSDDKWGTAALLTILRALAGSKKPLRRKIILASTVDEENGVGNGLLLLTLAGVKAEGAIYLDGYQMNVLIGNLGGTFLLLRPRNPAGARLNAGHADRLREACRKLSGRRADLFDGTFYKDNAVRGSSINLIEWKDAKGPCFNINFYTLPGEDKRDVCAGLEMMVKEALGEELHDYELDYRKIWFEPALISPSLPHVQCLAAAAEEVLKAKPIITTISKQDAFVLTNHAGIPTVSFGPASRVTGKGAFHNVDECLAVEEAWTGCRIACDAVFRWLET
jgi:acetylornithine deacetylase/succinyl-diaminopimelate desuccinylase-like protein